MEIAAYSSASNGIDDRRRTGTRSDNALGLGGGRFEGDSVAHGLLTDGALAV